MYIYEDLKDELLEEDNQKKLFEFHKFICLEQIKRQFGLNKIWTMQDLMKKVPYVPSSWLQMAFIDRMVELGTIEEINKNSSGLAQYRQFRL